MTIKPGQKVKYMWHGTMIQGTVVKIDGDTVIVV